VLGQMTELVGNVGHPDPGAVELDGSRAGPNLRCRQRRAQIQKLRVQFDDRRRPWKPSGGKWCQGPLSNVPTFRGRVRP
jgi:hypothetical protein